MPTQHEITGPHDRDDTVAVEYLCTCGTWTCVADPSDDVPQEVLDAHSLHQEVETGPLVP